MQTNNGTNFNLMHIGDGKNVKKQLIEIPGMGKVSGKLFLKQPLNLTGMEVSINVLPPGGEIPFKHRHRMNEELYFFIQGKGEFEIDSESFEVKSGTMLRISPQGVRQWRNTGSDDLYYLVIQARADSMAASTIEDGELVAG